MADPSPAAPLPDPANGRSPWLRCCSGVRKDGQPCQAPALRGQDLCRYHSARLARDKSAAGIEHLNILPISTLIHLNVTIPESMERFRRGLMSHIARGTLDGVQVKHMHELAMAIRDDAPRVNTTSTRDRVRRGLGHHPPGAGGEIEVGGMGGKGPTAATEGISSPESGTASIEFANPPTDIANSASEAR